MFKIDMNSMQASSLEKKIFSYEEGKVTTVKNDGTLKFPERALMLGFKEFEITPDEVDKWVFPTPKSKISMEDFDSFFSWFFKAYTDNYDKFEDWFHKHVIFVDHQLSHAALAHMDLLEECAFYVWMEEVTLVIQGGMFLVNIKTMNLIQNFNQSAWILLPIIILLTDAIGFSGDDTLETSGLASYGKIEDQLKTAIKELISISKLKMRSQV